MRRVRGHRAGQRGQGGRVLGDVHHPGGDPQPGAVALRRPVQPGLPRLRLPRRQGGGEFGAVAQQVGLGVARQFQRHRPGVGSDALLRGAGEPGERHVGIGHLAALGAAGRLPLGGDRLGQRACGQQQRRAAGQAHRAAVQQHLPGVAVRPHGRGIPETLHRNRPRRVGGNGTLGWAARGQPRTPRRRAPAPGPGRRRRGRPARPAGAAPCRRSGRTAPRPPARRGRSPAQGCGSCRAGSAARRCRGRRRAGWGAGGYPRSHRPGAACRWPAPGRGRRRAGSWTAWRCRPPSPPAGRRSAAASGRGRTSGPAAAAPPAARRRTAASAPRCRSRHRPAPRRDARWRSQPRHAGSGLRHAGRRSAPSCR